MKVIKKEDVANWSHKITCVTCNSELEVEAKDLYHYQYAGDFRDAGSSDVFRACCIVCAGTLTIPVNSIPKLVQVETKKKSVPRLPSGRD